MNQHSQLRTKSVNSTRAGEATFPDSIRVLGSSRVARLHSARFTMGTAKENDLVLADKFISKHHCTLMAREGGVWVQDEGSRNGTWVDNVRIDRCRVAAGSRIVLGHTCLELMGPDHSSPHPFGLVGEHPLMKRVLSQIERFGPTLKPVLILGETGTGKELVARALHECSLNRPGPFEPLNCGAIPGDLAESELFGHTEGAFTGACRSRKGAFERADGGSLFLDEVGEMPRGLQPKLLRALEDEAIQRIGEERRRRIKIRLIAATHRDLLRDSDQGRFRLDLYHRLAVAVIHLPPLRERREDIPLLVEHFLRKEQPSGAEIIITPDAISFLMDQPWRGNIRSLLHMIEIAATLDTTRIGPADLRAILCDTESPAAVTDGFVRYRGREFDAVRHEVYTNVLREHEGNHTAAASALGIPKSTFFDQVRTMRIGYRSDPGG